MPDPNAPVAPPPRRPALAADLIIANAPDPVFVCDLDGKILEAGQGDAAAAAALAEIADWLGYGLSIALNMFNPDVVVLGGGLVEIGDAFLASTQAAVQKYAYPPVRETPLRLAALGPQAGLIGAGLLARQARSRSR